MEYVLASGETPEIDVSDVLKLVDPKMEKKQALDLGLINREEYQAKLRELNE